MKRTRNTILWLLTGLLSLMAAPALSQTGFTVNIKKPEQYEKRVLKAEKTKEGKLKEPKHFFQNLTTHYNYYFNANNKLQEVIARAKEAAHDDYTSLLPFYNYSLDVTAADKAQLDSVIYKTQTGVVLHDLRNDWNDDLYLLWGTAYFLQKKFDSAALMFQFINYSYADKEKDGYYKYIGSNLNDNNKELTIATKEPTGFSQKMLSRPPSRNTAFLWQIKTLIEAGNFEQSGSLITTLKADPQFPERLYDDLEEVQAYWFYKQKVWDSSATHLLNALDVAANKLERSRWEFLAAQMYERSGHAAEAQQWFEKTVAHTPDPVMEIYARLNLIRINKSGGDNYIDQNIAALLKMARKDKYEDYRDIIYFMAARMETERGNLAAAQELLLKGARYVGNDPAARSKAFLLIADIAYGEKKYGLSAGFYDSVQLASLAVKDTARVLNRKRLLAKIVGYTAAVSRQDSLQRIAAMPEQERAVYLSRLVKQLRKEQGLKEDASAVTSGTALVAKNVSADLFANTAKGEWYFYNTGSKTQGLAQFKQVWGSRPNVDNWRRFADVNKQLLVAAPNNTRPPAQASTGSDFDNTPTFNTLLNNLPLTQTAIKSSNDSIRNALYELGNTYLNDAEDYTSAITTFEELRRRFPDDVKMDEVLFDLYYMNNKWGNGAGAAEIRTALQQRFPASRFTAIVSTGKDPDVRKALAEKATADYEAIYDLYLAGRFSEAEAAKKSADSLYKTTYWQPQLLYIDAVYHIRQRDDSVAKSILNTLIGQNPGSAIGSKAQTLLEVLNRRAQIEDELAKLQIERPAEDDYNPPKQAVTQIAPPVSVIHVPVLKDTALAVKRPEVSAEAPPKSPELKKQTSVEGPVRGNNAKPAVKVPVKAAEKAPLVAGKPVAAYIYDAGARHYSIIILNKVDPVFANEAKNAFTRYNREKYPAAPLQITVLDLDADHRLLLTGVFDNAASAIDYTQKTARVAGNEVVPWLKSDKFSFSILSETNLELLKEKKDLEAYKKFVEVSVPAKW